MDALRTTTCGPRREILPASQREALLYRFAADLPYSDVAAALGHERGGGPATGERGDQTT